MTGKRKSSEISTIRIPITIEKNVILGAGSVVTKNCKKNKIYKGNPAKIYKKNAKK